MAEQVLTDVGIWIAGVSYAGVSNSVGIEVSADTPEKTVFKDEWRTRAEGGLKTSKFSLDGFFDTVITDEAQFASLGTERNVMVVPAGMTPGALAYIVPVTVSGHKLSGSVGDLLAFTYASEGDGQAYRAQVMDIRDSLTVLTPSTRLDLGPIATGQTLHLWVHVNRIAGTLRVRLRSADSEANLTTTMRADSMNLTATGLTLLSVAGPITDEWWFLQYTPVGTTDFDAASAFVIE